jgi:hypothetical protein
MSVVGPWFALPGGGRARVIKTVTTSDRIDEYNRLTRTRSTSLRELDIRLAQEQSRAKAARRKDRS